MINDINLLIQKKREKEATEIKEKEIMIPSLGDTMVFKKPTDSQMLKAFDSMEDDSKECIDEAYKELIYNCCNMLHDETLRQTFNIVDPVDIVTTLFTLKDRFEIGDKLTEMAGFRDENSIGTELKNS